MNHAVGKVLLVVGLAVACLGLAVLLLADRPGFWQRLWQRFPLFRLPGDIRYRGEGFSFYFPWVTCLVVSIALTVLAWIFRK